MNKKLQLLQKRAEVAEKAKALNQKAADEKRELTSEEQVSFDQMYAEMRGLTTQLENVEKVADIDRTLAEERGKRREADPDAGGDEEQVAAFRNMLRFGDTALTPEARKLLTPGRQTSQNFRADRDAQLENRSVQSELTGNLGGYIVPQGFWAEVQTALKYFGGMFNCGAREITTNMGNDLPVPTSDDTSNVGRRLAESSPVTQTAIPFGQVILKAYKYSSDLILVPIELLQDSGVDIEAYIREALVTRLGRIMNTDFTTNNDGVGPRGVVIDATLGKTGASGQVATIIYDDIVDLKYSVNKAYRSSPSTRWMMSDAMLKVILKLKDQNLRPLILDYITTLQQGEPEQLLGQPIVINNDMAVPAASAKSLLYGDFRNYWIRKVMAMLMMRLVERYADAGQVAFLAFMRADGRMVDAGTHPIQYYINAAS